MDYNDFIYRAKYNLEMPTVSLPSGMSYLNPNVDVREATTSKRREALGSTYALKYRLEDDLDIEKDSHNDLEEMEGLTSVAGTLPNPEEIMSERLTQVYDLYPFDKKNAPDLLVNKYKEEILEAIESSSVVIIKGMTGCGKTTQVPQFILDQHRSENIRCNIVVTQPRRIATRSVAQRVATERGWGLGTIVGYQIALDRKTSEDTRLLYCTTGVLLQNLISQQSLSKYTHIIVDEVHERDQDTDFLLILLKTFLRMSGCRTKIILMSATMTTEKFQEYFTKKIKTGPPIRPPVVVLKQEEMYPVVKFYLDDLASENASYITIPSIDINNPAIDATGYKLACTLIEVFHTIDQNEEDGRDLGAVLVFLPGLHEIEHLHSALTDHWEKRKLTKEKWWVCPLHSSVTFDEQMNVFKTPPLGHRKIILATNIAESSITVPDVKYVIDFCLVKQQVQEPESGYSYLAMQWVSKSQADQRAGRAGRVRPGRIYRIVNQYDFEMFDAEHEPEILRCSLESLVLKAKQLSPESPPAKILAWAIDPPDLSNIHRTISYLKELGALMVYTRGIYKEDDGDLTYIGHIMASLPLDVQLSKLIVVGYMFSQLRESIAMACTCAVRSVFSTPFKRQLEAYNSKIAWSDSSCSDLIASVMAYEVWKQKMTSGYFSRTAGAKEIELTGRFFLQHRAMKEVYRLDQEITERLKRLNIVPNDVGYTNFQKGLVLKIIIAGAFYPNYFVRGSLEEKDAVKKLGGRNPFNTVYLTNMPMDQPGVLYASRIKDVFKDCGANCQVSFDGSSKVYLTFEGESDLVERTSERKAIMPGKIPMSVYRAIKLRQLQKQIILPIMPSDVAWARVNQTIGDKGLPQHNQRALKKDAPLKSHLPGVTTRVLEVLITHIDSPSSFYVQIWDSEYKRRLDWIHMTLSAPGAIIPLQSRPRVGQMIVAPYFEGNSKSYYRARVRAVVEASDKNQKSYNAVVFFIDFGNCEFLRLSELMDFGPPAEELREEPEMAMECTLSEIQPSLYANFKGLWSNLATTKFQEHFGDSHAVARIFSSVNNVVSVILFHPRDVDMNSGNIEIFEMSFNHYLIRERLAERCDESYLSRENHNLRETALKRPDLVHPFASTSFLDHTVHYMPSPSDNECRLKVALKGPVSPLEMKLHSLSKETQGKEVNIAWDSVNSVLLDTFPQDPHERFVVAGLVSLNPSREKLTLRNTTLMPNCHGLLAICSMLFAPRVELRADADRTRLIGAICGLGYDPVTRESYCPEKDMEMNFDVVFDLTDLEQINKLRYQMNLVVFGGKDWEKEKSAFSVATSQEKIKTLLINILRKERPPQGAAGCNTFQWGCITDGLLQPAQSNTDLTNNVIFPLIWGVEIDEEAFREKVGDNLFKLQQFADGEEVLYRSTKCELCQVVMEDIAQLKEHLASNIHHAARAAFLSKNSLTKKL